MVKLQKKSCRRRKDGNKFYDNILNINILMTTEDK